MSTTTTSTNDPEISYETYRQIDARLTFRVANLFRTISILTLCHFGPPSPHNPAVYDLAAMVRELESLGICGYERTKAWMVWHVETARLIFECSPKVKVGDLRAGVDFMVRPGGEFRDVAGAVYEVLAEDLGFGAERGR